MPQALEISQSKGGFQRSFQFSENVLVYKLSDASGSQEYSIPYESIDVSLPSTLKVNTTPYLRRLYRIGVVLMVTPLIAMAKDESQPIWIALFVIALVITAVAMTNRWTRLLSVTFTVVYASNGPAGTSLRISVLHDKHLKSVLDLLTANWKERVRALYGRADPSADRVKETSRLGWLRERGVIDEAWYQQELGRLRGSLSEAGDGDRIRLN